MPQFDFVTVCVQILWFSLAVVAFYLIYLMQFSKKTAEVIKIRARIHSFANQVKDKIQKSDLYNQIMKFAKRK